MRKICVVTANRAEYSRGRAAIRAIHKQPNLKIDLVVMGSHLLERYGHTIKEVESDGIPVNHRIYMELDGKNPCTMTKSLALAINDLATYFENTKPDVVVALTDRYEILGVAVAAAMMNIPIAHIQGGEVTGTIDESIRHAITKMAHIHFPATEKSRERIIKMGELPNMVFNVGCPATDLLITTPKFNHVEILKRVNLEVFKGARKLNPGEKFLLVIQHPVTTEYGVGLSQVQQTLNAIRGVGIQSIILWPNIDAGSDEISKGIRHFEQNYPEKYIPIKHIPHEIFVNLLRHTACMIGNSSAGIRESCYFGTPTVNIGTRQQDRERGKNVLCAGYDKEEIEQAISKQINHAKYEPEYVYGNGHAGEQIAEILATIKISDVQKKITY